VAGLRSAGNGAEVLVTDEEAKKLVDAGFAEVIGEAAPKRRAKPVNDPDVPLDA
jgi:hypothetical protein